MSQIYIRDLAWVTNFTADQLTDDWNNITVHTVGTNLTDLHLQFEALSVSKQEEWQLLVCNTDIPLHRTLNRTRSKQIYAHISDEKYNW